MPLEKPNPIPIPESQVRTKISALLCRTVPDHYKRVEGVDSDEVKRSLEANPALIESLAQMDESGGAPDIIAVTDEYFIFADCSEEVPKVRCNVNYDQAQEMAKQFGVDLIDRIWYFRLQGIGKFDWNTYTWVDVLQDLRGTGAAFRGGRDADGVGVMMRSNSRESSDYHGWRGVLKVPRMRLTQ